MKTLIKQIKMLAMATVLTFSTSIYSQNETKTHNVFVRVYNLQGNTISKGPIAFINDSVIGLKNNSTRPNINMKDIGFIKTKRSAGNNVLIGVAAGALIGGVLGASSADPNDWFGYTSGEGAVLFGGLGALGGGAIGGLTSLGKNSETYIIIGSEVNWKSFQKIMGVRINK